MGFGRATAREAILHAQSLEAATEWILSHSEDLEIMQAITMSLESSLAPEDSPPQGQDVVNEVKLLPSFGNDDAVRCVEVNL